MGGRIYRIDPKAQDVAEITIKKPDGSFDANPSTFERGWSCQGETWWIYNDGQTLPFIWNGGSARRAKPGEIGPGTVISYVQGRLWYALPDGLSFRATDLVGNIDSGSAIYGYRDSILHETENDYLNEGGDFRVPANCGAITAMAATSILDTSQGQGPLQVLCQRNGFTVNTPVDRTIWKSVTYPIQTESLIGSGCSGAQNTIPVNGDLFFRAPDGLRSFIVARRQFRDWGNTPQSFEMSGIMDFDQKDLLTFGSSAVFDNRFLMTLSPTWSQQGVYHRGLAVIDLSPITSLTSSATPVYDGLWTGLKILAIRSTEDGTYMLVLADDASLELWEVTQDELFDNGDGRIQWSVVPRAMFIEPSPSGMSGRTLKRLEGADIEYDELAGLVDFRVSWKPDSYPCPTIWAEWSDCVTDCFSVPDCSNPLVFHTGYQPRKRLPEPPNECAVGVSRPLRNFYTLNPRIDITGPARLLSCRFAASVQPEPKYDPNTCSPFECVPLQCCDLDLFTYSSTGQGCLAYGSGSGSGSGSGGSSPPTSPTDTGACCVGTSCSIMTQQACIAAGGVFLGKDSVCTPGICDSTPPRPPLPKWPTEDLVCATGLINQFPPIVVVDSAYGGNGYPGFNCGGCNPYDYFASYPDCIDQWATAVWTDFVNSGTDFTQAQLVFCEVQTSGDNTTGDYMAQQVFPGQPGGYFKVGDLNWKIVVQWCNDV